MEDIKHRGSGDLEPVKAVGKQNLESLCMETPKNRDLFTLSWRRKHYEKKIKPERHFGFEYLIAVTDFQVIRKSKAKNEKYGKEISRNEGGRELKELGNNEKKSSSTDEELGEVEVQDAKTKHDNPHQHDDPAKKELARVAAANLGEIANAEGEMEDEAMTDNEQLLGFLLEDIRSTFPNSIVIRSTEATCKTLMVLVAVTEKDLIHVADRTKPYMKLNAVRAHARAYALDLPLAAHFSDKDSVWKDLYAPFEEDYADLYETYEELKPGEQKGVHQTKFRQVDRLATIDYVVNDEDLVNGLNLDEKYEPIFEAAFPLHNEYEREILWKEWQQHLFLCCRGSSKQTWPFNQPVDNIERYLGQKITLYFEFLRMHTLFLILPSLVGIGIFVYQQYQGVDNVATAVYSLFVVLHFFIFCRVHEQNEHRLATRWGSHKVSEEEKIRPEYRGEVEWSSIDGSLELNLPTLEKVFRTTIGAVAVTGIVIFIYGALVGGFFAEMQLNGTVFSGSIFAVMLVIVNALTRVLAEMLTNFENPKTNLEFKKSLITKLTVFKFMTGFGLLYYSAFIQQPAQGGCGDVSCEERTANLLRGTFIGMIIINNLMEIGLPCLIRLYRMIVGFFTKCCYGDSEDYESPLEQQLHSDAYSGTLDDYDELINQIGFTTFFVPFFPIAPALAILNNFIEVQVDSTKILWVFRRAVPERAASSAEWNRVLLAFSYIMLLTNAASIMFRFQSVSELVGAQRVSEKFFGFLVICVSCILIKLAIINPLIPPETKQCRDHIARQEYLWPFLLGIKSRKEDLEFSYEFDLAQIHDEMANDKSRLLYEIEETERDAIPERSKENSGCDAKNDPKEEAGGVETKQEEEKESPREEEKAEKDKTMADGLPEHVSSQVSKPKEQVAEDDEDEARPVGVVGKEAEDERVISDKKMDLNERLEKGLHLPTFFTGGRSPVMNVAIEFKGGKITDIRIQNEPPTQPPVPVFSCFGKGGYEELDEIHEQAVMNANISSQMQGISDTNGNVVKDGTVILHVQKKKGEGRFITNVYMRFALEPNEPYAALVGISFDINFIKEEKNRIWIGQNKGGRVIDLLSSDPSTGEKGRPGAVAALKGVRLEKDRQFLALEWLCMVFPKVMQMRKTSDKRIKVIKEGSGSYLQSVVPQVYAPAAKFFPGTSMHV